MIQRKKNVRRSVRSVRSSKGRDLSMPDLDLKPHTVREIEAVLLVIAGVIFLLLLIGKAGTIGFYVNDFVRSVLGVGVWLVPPFLVGLAWTVSRVPDFHMSFSKGVGAGVSLASLLGLIHLSVPVDQLLEVARAGERGGYIGFTFSWLLSSTVGQTAAGIMLLGGLVIGLLITFDVSLSKLVLAVKWFFEVSPEGAHYVPLNEEYDDTNLPDDPAERRVRPRVRTAIAEKFVRKPSIHEAMAKVPTAKLLKDGPTAEVKVQINAPGGEKEMLKIQKKELREKIAATPDFAPKSLKPVKADWKFPSVDLLDDQDFSVVADSKVIDASVARIQQTLAHFDIPVEMGEVNVGPTVTQYAFRPADGVKLSRITALQNDLALALAAESTRIEAPIPGKALVGLELPNKVRTDVRIRGIIESPEWHDSKADLKLAIGRNISGKPVIADLGAMPHLLIAGATGSGKSVCMNTILVSLLYQRTPEEMRLLLVDPKRVELTLYNGVPHLLTPVIAEPEKTVTALRWVVAEMNRRYKVLEEVGEKNIKGYNKAIKSDIPQMPYIVVVIDELADIMLVASKEVEALICRLAQMARAVGIHLIIATQRPSVDVVTGLIKANFPTRIAFAVTSGVDSRTIIDTIGAEKLLGKGDMLFMTPSISKPVRLQGVYLSPQEIKRVVSEVKLLMQPDYVSEIVEKKHEIPSGLPGAGTMGSLSSGEGEGDDGVEKQALEVIVTTGRASASLLQRRLRLGYARAARVLDLLEEKGYIGPSQGAKPRDIYVTKEKLAEIGVAATAGAVLASTAAVGISEFEEVEAEPEEVENEDIPDWE